MVASVVFSEASTDVMLIVVDTSEIDKAKFTVAGCATSSSSVFACFPIPVKLTSIV